MLWSTQVAPWTHVPRRASLPVNQLYPGVTGGAAADAMLGFADLSHQSNLPSHAVAVARLAAFQQLFLSDGQLDLETELGTLEADLQAIIDGP